MTLLQCQRKTVVDVRMADPLAKESFEGLPRMCSAGRRSVGGLIGRQSITSFAQTPGTSMFGPKRSEMRRMLCTRRLVEAEQRAVWPPPTIM